MLSVLSGLYSDVISWIGDFVSDMFSSGPMSAYLPILLLGFSVSYVFAVVRAIRGI